MKQNGAPSIYKILICSLVYLVYFFSTFTSTAFASQISCPEDLDEKDIDVERSARISDWLIMPSGYNRDLLGIVVYEGEPSRKLSEPNNSESESVSNRTVVTVLSWDLSTLTDPWVQCIYQNTQATLARSVSGKTKCTVVRSRNLTSIRDRVESATCE